MVLDSFWLVVRGGPLAASRLGAPVAPPQNLALLLLARPARAATARARS